MDNNERIIVYRNRWEKDADDFWHSDAGTTLMAWLIGGVVVLFLVGIIVQKTDKWRNWRR